MKRLLYIVRLVLAVILPMLLALASAMAQTVVPQGTSNTLVIVAVPGDSYSWELYNDPSVNFAKVPGNCPPAAATFVGGNTGPSVVVQWLQPGIYFYKVTARDASLCTKNFRLGMFKVVPNTIVAKIVGDTQTGACQQVKLDGSKSTGDIVKYEWTSLDVGGALTNKVGITTEFSLSPAYKGPLPAAFRVKLVVTDKLGATSSDIITIKVDLLPEAEVYSTGKLEKDGTMIVDGSVSTGNTLSYLWTTLVGKIVGPNNQPQVNLNGAGNYALEITDIHGCKSTKVFNFPVDIYQISLQPDYAKITWPSDTTLNVLANDVSTIDLVPGTVRVVKAPSRGETRVNVDGTITYTPTDRHEGRDQFD